MKVRAITAAIMLGAFVLLVAALWGFNLYMSQPVDSFCEGVSPSDTREQLISRAISAGLIADSHDRDENAVFIFNQQAPFWRFACVVEFRDGKFIGKSVIAAD